MTPRRRSAGSTATRSSLRLLTLLVFGLAITACTRPRPGMPPLDATQPSEAAETSSLEIEVDAPSSEASVGSPVAVSGRVRISPDQRLVALVHSGSDGEETWRGNTTLDVGADGRFDGQVPYTLDTPGPGIVELAIVDPASGTVLSRQRIAVGLSAAP